MYYSLLSRFQGGLMGSFLGDSLRNRYGGIEKEPFSDWQQVGICGLLSLSEQGKLDLVDWQQRVGKPELERKGSISEVAIALLPVILFFHDSRNFLTETILAANQLWLSPDANPQEILLWSEIMLFALTGKSSPQTWLTQNSPQRLPQTELEDQISQGKELLNHFAPIERVLATITHPLAFAVYCFNCIPEDFRLCLQRANRHRDPEAANLAGAIAGTYNALAGIPLDWRFHYSHPEINLAHRLFNTWSGVYQPKGNNLEKIAIASPGTIQPRSSLQIISQREYY